MRTLLITTLVAGMALAAGASAVASDDGAPAAKPAAKRACFFPSQINGWSDDRTAPDDVVYLNIGVRDVYRVDMLGGCNGIGDATTIGVENRGGGMICDGLGVTLITGTPIGPYRCPVSKITKLTPEEARALSARRRN